MNLWTIPTDAVRAIDRFNHDGPTGFQAVEPWAKDAPVRATRDEAMADVTKHELREVDYGENQIDQT